MDDLISLQSSIRLIESRLNRFDRALFSLQILTKTRFERVISAFEKRINPQIVCSSPFTKRVLKSPLKQRPQSPCLFLLPRGSKRTRESSSVSEKRGKLEGGWLSFGGEVIEEEKENLDLRDEYEMSGEEGEEGKGKYVPLWALEMDMKHNEDTDPDLIFAPRTEDLSASHNVGFSCHLEQIFPSVSTHSKHRNYLKRGDSANWALTNL